MNPSDLGMKTCSVNGFAASKENSTILENNPLSNVLSKIQNLIDNNEEILITSEINVKEARSILKAAENNLLPINCSSKADRKNVNKGEKRKYRLKRRIKNKRLKTTEKSSVTAISCDSCKVNFSNCKELLDHDKFEHSDLPRLASCANCSEQFLTHYHLEIHVSFQHAQKYNGALSSRMQCKCSKPFNSSKYHCSLCKNVFCCFTTKRQHLLVCNFKTNLNHLKSNEASSLSDSSSSEN